MGMYLNFWNLKRKPFAQQIQTEMTVATDSYESCRLKLEYLIDDQKSFGLVLGDVGVGKTFLLQSFTTLRRHQMILLQLSVPPTTREELYQGLAREIEFPLHEFAAYNSEQQLQVIVQRLFEWAQEGLPVLIVIDDAHLQIQRDVLVGLQLILKHFSDRPNPVHFLLSGHYSLRETLSQVPELEDRIDVVAQMRTMNHMETGMYISRRLEIAGCSEEIFLPETISYIHELSNGSPRRVNRLCDLALLVAYAEESRTIAPEMITGVVEEVFYQRAA
jgi:general secretion pathway protein A